MRDIQLGETVYFNFTTRQFSDGVPTVLTGSQALSVLEENNATPITAGVSVEVSRASVVGLNQATIVATGGNGYESGKGYCVYISAGTVGGDSVVGEVVAEFTIEASAAAQDLANGTDGLTALKAETALIVGDTAGIAGAAMRGTDSAALASVCLEARLAELDGANLPTDVAANATPAEVATELATYDGPTKAEMDTAHALLATPAQVATELGTYDGPTRAELTTDINSILAVTGALADAAADGDPTATDTLVAYLKQIVNVLVGGDGVTAFPAEQAPANAINLAEVIRAIHTDVTGLADSAMRGTDSAALASVCTEPRLSELDEATAGKMANQVDEIRTDTGEIGAAGAGLSNITWNASWDAEVESEVNDALDL